MNNRTYVILPATVTIAFSQCLETSAETLRWNLAGSNSVVHFVGDTPAFLEGLGLTHYTHQEIRTVLATSEWSAPPPQ
jgi:hypothetical protein